VHKAFLAALFPIPVVSRTMAGLGVLSYKPIGHSQYRKSYETDGKLGCKAAMILQLLVCLIAAAPLAGPRWLDVVLPALVVAGTAFLAMLHARRWLGGMSGDIAGYAICWSELAGVLGLAVFTGGVFG
jgi:adenosylcobinamide-GDP ribazoletransferase